MDWNKILETVIMVLIPVLIPALVAYLIALTKKALAQAKAGKPDLMFALEEAAKFAVQAAEQSQLSGLITDKKAYALQIAEDYLVSKGVKLDLHMIDAAIESAVWTELNKEKPE
jgi:hypothetical protein